MVATSGGDGGGRLASVEGSQRLRLERGRVERDGKGGEVLFARFVRVFTVKSESVKMPNRYGLGGRFAPHCDSSFTRSACERSWWTVSIFIDCLIFENISER